MFRSVSYLFLITGLFFIILGILAGLLGSLKVEKLPGDIVIRKENFTFYFPLATSILLSIFLSVIFTIFVRIFRR